MRGLTLSLKQFTLAIKGENIFLLKINLRAVFLELSHGGKAVYCISRKTTDGLCNNKVNFTVQGILHHLIEPITVFGIRGRDAFVGVNGDELPVITSFDEFRIIIDLRFIACKLLVAVRGHTSVVAAAFGNGSVGSAVNLFL